MTALRPRLARRLGRRVLAWRYRLFQQHRHDRLVLEDVAGRPILVLPGVFNPKLFRTGELLARCLDAETVPAGASVLDLGTGSGVGAVFAARHARRVVAVDINPAAVRCARMNALLNECEARVDVRQGDLFAPVAGERFDLVLFNPPYYAGEPRDELDRAFRAPGVLERFAAGLDGALAPGGRALLALSSDVDPPHVLALLATHGFGARALVRRELINETLEVDVLQRERAG